MDAQFPQATRLGEGTMLDKVEKIPLRESAHRQSNFLLK